MFLSDTIVALATPAGTGGIGVLRLSGSKARYILAQRWSGKTPVSNFEARKLYLGGLNDAAGALLDQVMAVYFAAPKSYTGEELVEISAHGSPVLLKKILQSLTQAGARLAEPGEFTKRAFLNGKLDLSQAEAVGTLIHATSEQAANAAREQLCGNLSVEVEALHQELTTMRAFVEATIDFPEDDVEMLQHEKIAEKLSATQERIAKLLASYARGRLLKEGLKVILLGQPNVGKSSLLNLLAGSERAIVHHEPGTTRDVIEVTLELAGIPVTLLDTAGIRDAHNSVEQIGVEKSRAALQNADLVLLLVDATKGWTKIEEELLQEIDKLKKPKLIVFNKTDLKPSLMVSSSNHAVLRQAQDERVPFIHFSTKTKLGLEELFQQLESFLRPQNAAEGHGVVLTELRHKNALETAQQELHAAQQLVQRAGFSELIAQHLRMSQVQLAQIIGKDVTEDMLNAIFSQFCIGK